MEKITILVVLLGIIQKALYPSSRRRAPSKLEQLVFSEKIFFTILGERKLERRKNWEGREQVLWPNIINIFDNDTQPVMNEIEINQKKTPI